MKAAIACRPKNPQKSLKFSNQCNNKGIRVRPRISFKQQAWWMLRSVQHAELRTSRHKRSTMKLLRCMVRQPCCTNKPQRTLSAVDQVVSREKRLPLSLPTIRSWSLALINSPRRMNVRRSSLSFVRKTQIVFSMLRISKRDLHPSAEPSKTPRCERKATCAKIGALLRAIQTCSGPVLTLMLALVCARLERLTYLVKSPILKTSSTSSWLKKTCT